MKILHIIPSLQIGGAEISLEKLIINDNENEHIVLCLKEGGPIYKRLAKHNIDIYFVKITNIFNFIPGFLHLVYRIFILKTDIIQTWMYHSDLIGGIAAKFAGAKKIIWSIRCSEALTFSGSGLSAYLSMKLCVPLSYLIPKKIICVANSAKFNHQKQGYCSKKMHVIHNGYDYASKGHDDGKEHSSDFVIPKNTKVIGSIGRFNEYKDYDNFFRAAKKILLLRQDIKFLLVGNGLDKDNKKLLQTLKDHDLNLEDFLLVGETENVSRYFDLIDIFCLHSRSEGFPNVLVEAIMSETLVISTNVGDVESIIKVKECIIPKENSSMLAKKATYFLDMNQDIKQNIISLNFQLVREKFTIENFVSKHNSLYKRL